MQSISANQQAQRRAVDSRMNGTGGGSTGYLMDNHQYSVQALVLLTDVTATLLDLIYRSEEKEQRATPLLNSILCNVFPYLKNHR